MSLQGKLRSLRNYNQNKIFAKLSKLLYLSPLFLGCGSAATEDNNIDEPIELDADSSYSWNSYEKDIKEKDNIQEEDNTDGYDTNLYETDALSDICNGKVYYKDNDNDGYGIHTDFVMICEGADIPFNYVLEKKLGWDCNDKNTDVYPAAPEICDNLDNDCNDIIDDVPSTVCYNSNEYGSCKGKISCSGIEMVCDAAMPAKEECNGKDDNCNGQKDENLIQKCYTSCGEGIEYCVNGIWQSCDAPKPKTEDCDGEDDDCDGETDDNLSQPCYTSCGEGLEYCVNGTWEGCTAQKPEEEVCDGKDNNCNYSIDEGLLQSCFSACGEGIEKCVNGVWQNCDAPLPQPEICDGINNNCNKQIDENLTQPCSTVCGSGLEYCVNSTWQGCDAPLPQPEYCNGKDDNCNGQMDEDLTQPCTTICGTGIEYCVNSTWQNCDAPLPQPEICNGIDDDCNGQTDEGVQLIFYQDKDGDSYGNLYETIKTCSQPDGYVTVPFDCDDNNSKVYVFNQEICNNVDDNCDGQTDEDLTLACSTVCGSGLEYCINGTWQGCDAPLPQPEDCNGKDDNCNKSVDEDLTQPCSTVCGMGIEYCINGTWQGCDAPLPQPEDCNGKDDNCNKSVDEDLTQPCSTVCGEGLEYCVNGTWQNCDAPISQPEVCDGIDNDCNGQIDENNICDICYFQDDFEDGTLEPWINLSSKSAIVKVENGELVLIRDSGDAVAQVLFNEPTDDDDNLSWDLDIRLHTTNSRVVCALQYNNGGKPTWAYIIGVYSADMDPHRYYFRKGDSAVDDWKALAEPGLAKHHIAIERVQGGEWHINIDNGTYSGVVLDNTYKTFTGIYCNGSTHSSPGHGGYIDNVKLCKKEK